MLSKEQKDLAKAIKLDLASGICQTISEREDFGYLSQQEKRLHNAACEYLANYLTGEIDEITGERE